MTLPQILQRKICSPLGEKSIYFPSGNPKNSVFRREGHDPPLQLMPGVGFFDSLKAQAFACAFCFFNYRQRPVMAARTSISMACIFLWVARPSSMSTWV